MELKNSNVHFFRKLKKIQKCIVEIFLKEFNKHFSFIWQQILNMITNISST